MKVYILEVREPHGYTGFLGAFATFDGAASRANELIERKAEDPKGINYKVDATWSEAANGVYWYRSDSYGSYWIYCEDLGP